MIAEKKSKQSSGMFLPRALNELMNEQAEK